MGLELPDRTLSATIGPLVALVSAAMTTPPSYMQPTIVVPVDVALGSGTPLAWRARFRLWLLKSKPGIVAVEVSRLCDIVCGSGVGRLSGGGGMARRAARVKVFLLMMQLR